MSTTEDLRARALLEGEPVSVNLQLMSKLAGLESTVLEGFRRLDEKMERLQTDLHDSQINTNDRINALDKEFSDAVIRKRERIDTLEKRVVDIETWQAVAIAKVTVIMGVITALAMMFAPTVRHILGITG